MKNMKIISFFLIGSILTSCGGKLSEKDAKAALLEAQTPVEFRKAFLTEYDASHYQEGRDYFDVYAKAGLIDHPKKPKPHGNALGLNTRKIKSKGWEDYVSVRGNQVSIYNYMSRVGDIRKIDTNPIDRLCDALVEYTYEKYDYGPWGKDIEKVQFPTPIIWESCMIKHDNGWSVKDWKKKTSGRRR